MCTSSWTKDKTLLLLRSVSRLPCPLDAPSSALGVRMVPAMWKAKTGKPWCDTTPGNTAFLRVTSRRSLPGDKSTRLTEKTWRSQGKPRVMFRWKVYIHSGLWGLDLRIGQISKVSTTLQSLTNTKLSPHRFRPCHENGLIKIPTIPHKLYVSFKSAFLYWGLG